MEELGIMPFKTRHAPNKLPNINWGWVGVLNNFLSFVSDCPMCNWYHFSDMEPINHLYAVD